MNLIINILLGALAAFVTKYLLELLGIPAPIPMIGAVVAFLVVAFGGNRYLNL